MMNFDHYTGFLGPMYSTKGDYIHPLPFTRTNQYLQHQLAVVAFIDYLF